MAAVWVDIRTPAPTSGLGLIEAYGDLVIEVADTARARRFYGELLGFEPAGTMAEGPRLRVGERQHVVLAERPAPATRPDSGCHAAYRLPRAELAAVEGRLAACLSGGTTKIARPSATRIATAPIPTGTGCSSSPGRRAASTMRPSRSTTWSGPRCSTRSCSAARWRRASAGTWTTTRGRAPGGAARTTARPARDAGTPCTARR